MRRVMASAYGVYGTPSVATLERFARLESVRSPERRAFLAWKRGRAVAGAMGVPVERIKKIGEGSPNVVDHIESGEVVGPQLRGRVPVAVVDRTAVDPPGIGGQDRVVGREQVGQPRKFGLVYTTDPGYASLRRLLATADSARESAARSS